MFTRLLMVCTANICRSPLAEGLFRERLKEKNVQVTSAGVMALVGKPAVMESQEVARAKGFDISSHRAQQLTNDLVSENDLILVMEDWQKKEVAKMFPQARGKVFLLGRWRDFEIVDPYLQSMNAFEHVFELIDESFQDWNQKVWKVPL